MVIMGSEPHSQAVRSDTCVADRACTTDTILVLVATTSLPTTLRTTKARPEPIRSLISRIGRTSGPATRKIVTQGIVLTGTTARARIA